MATATDTETDTATTAATERDDQKAFFWSNLVIAILSIFGLVGDIMAGLGSPSSYISLSILSVLFSTSLLVVIAGCFQLMPPIICLESILIITEGVVSFLREAGPGTGPQKWAALFIFSKVAFVISAFLFVLCLGVAIGAGVLYGIYRLFNWRLGRLVNEATELDGKTYSKV